MTIIYAFHKSIVTCQQVIVDLVKQLFWIGKQHFVLSLHYKIPRGVGKSDDSPLDELPMW
jgi:hypothetical protein